MRNELVIFPLYEKFTEYKQMEKIAKYGTDSHSASSL
jgi:hypothetical protein